MTDSVVAIMDEVDKALPPLIPGIQETIEAGEAVEEKAEEVIEFFEDTTAKCKDLFEKVEEALEASAKESDEHITEVEAARALVENAIGVAKEKMENLRSLMSEELDEVKEGRDAFSDALDSVG